MNTGQMFTVLGALVLLSMVSLSINSMIINKTTTMLEAQASLNAISLAQSMLDEIMTKSFDLATVSAKIYDPSDLTAPSSLGPSSSEASNVPLPDAANPFRSVKYYNDVDYYHRYRRIASTPTMGPFTILDTVYYVVETNPDQKSSTQTFFKKVIVTVTHQNMTYPVKLSDVAIYRRYF